MCQGHSFQLPFEGRNALRIPLPRLAPPRAGLDTLAGFALPQSQSGDTAWVKWQNLNPRGEIQMSKRDIIIGTVVILAMVTVAVLVAISVYHHEIVGQ